VSRTAIVLAFFGVLLVSGRAAAEGVPPAVELPQQLSLEQSIQILRTRSLDVLIAEAAVRSAEGDESVAGAVPNPALSLGYGRVLPPYNPDATVPGTTQRECPGCSANEYTVSLSDQAAVEDSLSGKRSLRLKVARAALAAARLSRGDALRTIEFQVKSAYATLAQAQRALAFSRENQATNVKTVQLFEIRLKSGAINEGDLARVETQKL
jgi:outer membrane protein, heavy metal efflux system